MYKIDENTPIHWHGDTIEIILEPKDTKIHHYNSRCEIVCGRLFIHEKALYSSDAKEFLSNYIEGDIARVVYAND